MRLFIAIQFNRPMEDALTAVRDQWIRQGIKGNYTRRENWHLTLAFIGEYAHPERVLSAMESVPLQPFPLEPDGVGSYGGLWWVAPKVTDEMQAYVKALRRALADAGIPFDRKKFSPHITMIREPSSNRIPPVALPVAGMTVSHVSLMRSDRGKNGVIYTEIGGVTV